MMAEKKSAKLVKSEFWLANFFIDLALVASYSTMLLAGKEPVGEMVPALVVTGFVVVLVVAGIILYSRMKKGREDQEFSDERSDACSLKASRNAFFVSLLCVSLYMVLEQFASVSAYKIPASQGVFTASAAAYLISYFYYRRTG